MVSNPQICCPEHGDPLVPSGPGSLRCPADGCEFGFGFGTLGIPPLTPLAEGAAGHHELVLTYQAAGFSRTEAMQVLCCIISASFMKDKGSG
jgi:hypothetical protein